MPILAPPQFGMRSALVLDMGRGRQPRPGEKENITMIKLNQSGSANVNVLGEEQLGQVVGGRNHGGHRRRNYDHCYKNRYNDCYNYDGGYESKGSYDSSESSDCYEEKYDNYDYCDRRYS
jgi:hypothetical protein